VEHEVHDIESNTATTPTGKETKMITTTMKSRIKSSKQTMQEMRKLEQAWKGMPGGDAIRELVRAGNAWMDAQRLVEDAMLAAYTAQREADRLLAEAFEKAHAARNTKRTN